MPRSGWRRARPAANDRASSIWTRTRPIIAIASTPRSGRDPCAARPCGLDVEGDPAPMSDAQSSSSVGSATIAASARPAPQQAPPCRCSPASSSATAATMTSPRRPSPAHSTAASAMRREARLHVVGATAVQASVLDAGVQSPVRLEQPDGVGVPVQEQRPATTGPTRHADHVGPARRGLLDVDLEPCLLEPLREHVRHRRLATARRGESRVDRVDRDEPSRELVERGQRTAFSAG